MISFLVKGPREMTTIWTMGMWKRLREHQKPQINLFSQLNLLWIRKKIAPMAKGLASEKYRRKIKGQCRSKIAPSLYLAVTGA